MDLFYHNYFITIVILFSIFRIVGVNAEARKRNRDFMTVLQTTMLTIFKIALVRISVQNKGTHIFSSSELEAQSELFVITPRPSVRLPPRAGSGLRIGQTYPLRDVRAV